MLPVDYLTCFKDLCAIPHPSYGTKAVSDYCMRFAKERGLEAVQDGANNVVIRKPASKGYEDHPVLILQAHLDMVCEKTADSETDPATQPLALCEEGDYLFAKGTTLGGDDGIGVAYCLSVLSDDSLPHPPLEVLLTTDEEVGMLGADALDPALITGRRLINLDSEKEGELLVGCAGGAHVIMRLPVVLERKTGILYKIDIGGLLGGHSGTEIDKGHANAAHLLAEALSFLRERHDVSILTLGGGMKDNAIPRLAHAELVIGTHTHLTALEKDLSKLESKFRAKYPADAGVTVSGKAGKAPDTYDCFSGPMADRLLDLLCGLPNGVMKMSSLPGLVQTSLNLGILEHSGQDVTMMISVRSSVTKECEELVASLRTHAEKASASFQTGGRYPAWEFNPASPLAAVMAAQYKALYGKDCSIATIHAGLECGLFSEKWPGLDAVSCGPDLLDIHTPGEKLSLSSAKRSYDYLVRVISCL
ncbi:MAG: aminoacyl-histidine dipeptidase [Clostridia bacterium]|nr:aminoacyl-histidine dipeptidase [Clostridia bacterium]